MYLVVGLGNPGREYADNRHNIGFMVADEICRRFRLGPMKSKFGGEVGTGEAHGEKIAVLKPMEYMNLSGPPSQRAAAFFQIAPSRIVVIHDEIDLEFGRIRLKSGGGHGGHNGLRSLNEQLGPDYLRVRAGVGHPGSKDRVVGHVLGPFTKSEQAELPDLIGTCADAVEGIIKDGMTAAMNRWNTAPKGST